jgi:hypothetical protein
MPLFDPEPGEIVYLNDDGTRRAPWERPYCLCPSPTMHLSGSRSTTRWTGPKHFICPDCGRAINLSYRSDYAKSGRPWVPPPTGNDTP